MNIQSNIFKPAFRANTTTASKKFTNKKGENWELTYDEQGRISGSYKNGELFKYYNYKKPNLEKTFGKHSFADGTALSNKSFYDMDSDKAICYQVLAPQYSSHITINKVAKYKGEPIVRVEKLDDVSWTDDITTKPDGEEKIDFQTLDEAEQYFKDEYGIDAKFHKLIIAFLVKEAIDDYIRQNPEHDKRMFEGLKIDYKDLDNYMCPAQVSQPISYSDRIKNKEYENQQEYLDDIKSARDDEIRIDDTTLYFNTMYGWDNIEAITEDRYANNIFSTENVRHIPRHELAHCLESIQETPKEVLLRYNTRIPTPDIQPAIEISERAAYSISEFIAELAAGILDGKTYSAEIDKLNEKYNNYFK